MLRGSCSSCLPLYCLRESEPQTARARVCGFGSPSGRCLAIVTGSRGTRRRRRRSSSPRTSSTAGTPFCFCFLLCVACSPHPDQTLGGVLVVRCFLLCADLLAAGTVLFLLSACVACQLPSGLGDLSDCPWARALLLMFACLVPTRGCSDPFPPHCVLSVPVPTVRGAACFARCSCSLSCCTLLCAAPRRGAR